VGGTDRLIEIAADDITLIDRPESTTPAPAVTEDRSQPGPVPEVIFSTPTADDIDVPVDSLVRFQFSRDMDPESFDGHVEVEYFGAAPDSDDTDLEFEVEYRPRNRVINISFAEPLLPYRTIEVKLADDILATDGATLVPYTLILTTGGS